MNERIAPRGHCLRLNRCRVALGARSDLEWNDPAKIVVDFHDVDHNDPSVSAIHCEISAIWASTNAQQRAIHRTNEHRWVRPHRADTVRPHRAHLAPLVLEPPDSVLI